MLYQNCIGLDMREDKLNILALKSTYNAIKVLSQTTFPFDRELSTGQKVNVVGEIVSEFLKKNSLRDPTVYISIPRERVIIREVRLPLAVKENLRTTLGYEIQKYVPLAAGDIYFDYLVFEEDRSKGTLALLLFVIKKRDLDDYVVLSDRIGIALSGIQVQSTAIAAYLSVHPPNSPDGRIGIVRTDGKMGEASIYRNHTLEQTQFIAAEKGNGHLAKGLSKLLNALEKHAESYASVESVSWFYCHETNDGTSLDELNTLTTCDIAPLETAPTPLPGNHLLCAYGLALQGVRNLVSPINLLPARLRRKPSRLAFYSLIVLSVLTILAGAGWGSSFLIRNHMEMKRIDNQLAGLKEQITEFDALASQASEMERRIQNIHVLTDRRLSALNVLEELSSRIPTDTWIQELRMKRDGVQINGLSDSASELLALLEGSPVFKDAVFISAITKDKDGKERFRIGLTFQ